MEVEAESSSGKRGVGEKVKGLIGGKSWRQKLKVVAENVEFEAGVKGLIGGGCWKQ